MTKTLSSLLDWLRGLSAALVVIAHLRTHLFVDYVELRDPNTFEKVFYFFTLFGQAPVITFFVLSGYLVGGAFIRMSDQPNFLMTYAINRLTRLYVVVIPMLLVIYTFSIWMSFSQSHYSSAISFGSLLGTLLFLEGITGPSFGNNFPLWTLAYEFWYYCLFPLLWLSLWRQTPRQMRLACIILSVIALFALPNHLLAYFPHWLLGVSAYIMQYKAGRLLSVGSFIFAACISRVYWAAGNWFCDLVVAASVMNVIVAYKDTAKRTVLLERTATAAKNLSDFSFSLYVLHVPIIYMILTLSGSYESARLIPSWYYVKIYALFLAIIYLLAWLFANVTEMNTAAVRKTVFSVLSKRPAREMA